MFVSLCAIRGAPRAGTEEVDYFAILYSTVLCGHTDTSSNRREAPQRWQGLHVTASQMLDPEAVG
jgi:hypothetical protein